MDKVLITGAKGQVGSELIRSAPACFTVIGLGSEQLDITDQQQVDAAILKHQPTLIINAAAYTAVDKAESDIEKAFSINEQGVRWLARAAKLADIPLFHISTDYVFDGQASTPYTESDSANPLNIYGKSKLAGEQALSTTHDKYIILRTSWVFGTEGNNFVKTMLRLAGERDVLAVVADQYGSPTSAASIAKTLWQLAIKYRTEKDLPWGIYHFSNTSFCTWFDFAVEIFKQSKESGLLSKVPIVEAIATEDYPTPAIRPLWTVLDCTKIERLINSGCPSWQSELSAVLNNQS